MRVPNLYLWKYSKSLDRTKKVARTVTRQKTYVKKQQDTEKELELQKYLARKEELDNEIQEKLNKTIEELRVSEIQYYALIIYGIKLNKEKILEILKARKAK